MSEEAPPLPHAEGPEKSVLSSMLKDEQMLARGKAEGLTAGDFYLPANQALYQAMMDRLEAGGDLELVAFGQWMADQGRLSNIGGPSWLTEVFTYAPNNQHFDSHVAILRDRHSRRKSISACLDAIAAAHDCGDADGYLNALREPVARVMESAVHVGRRGFPITRAGELGTAAEPADFVEDLLTEGGASVVYGPSNVGKSFWILDLAAHVAAGKLWRDDIEVDQGAVVYVALEGAHGLRNRIEAMRLQEIITPEVPLFVCFSPVSLLDPTHAAKLVDSVKAAAGASSLPCRLVVLDTLARAMAGGNENAGEDMTAAVASIDAVKAATGAHVCVIHHCGKDEAKGARGHSSLRAAVDTEIEVFRPEGEHISTVRVTKQRDLECRDPMPFSLRSVEILKGRRGKPITSCVVKHEDEMMAADRAKPGRPKTADDAKLLEILPQPSTMAWKKQADEKFGVPKSSFYRAVERLRGNGAIEAADGRWIKQ